MGFERGLRAVFGGFAFIVRTPRSWPLALVPALVFLGLAALALALAVHWVGPAVREWAPDPDSAWLAVGIGAAAWAATAVCGLAGVLVAAVLAPALSGPALDPLVGMQEGALGLSRGPGVGVAREITSALKAQAVAIGVAVPALVLLAFVGLVVPPALVLTVPAKLLVGAGVVAWNLLDYPLALRGWGTRRRLAALRRHPTAVLGFGAGFALAFAIPCAGLLLLPAGVVGATQLLADLGELDDPAHAASLDRPRDPPDDGA